MEISTNTFNVCQRIVVSQSMVLYFENAYTTRPDAYANTYDGARRWIINDDRFDEDSNIQNWLKHDVFAWRNDNAASFRMSQRSWPITRVNWDASLLHFRAIATVLYKNISVIKNVISIHDNVTLLTVCCITHVPKCHTILQTQRIAMHTRPHTYITLCFL